MIRTKSHHDPAASASSSLLMLLLLLLTMNHCLTEALSQLQTNGPQQPARTTIHGEAPLQHAVDIASPESTLSRRTLLGQWCVATTTTAATLFVPTQPAWAKADCFTDCYKNCKAIAPKDEGYCQESCRDYCEQPDRQDGLSGSVSADQGEVGILGGSFGTGTVIKGQDKPPVVSLPGLDFSSDSGRKLIGY
jgi:hypothetical protein